MVSRDHKRLYNMLLVAKTSDFTSSISFVKPRFECKQSGIGILRGGPIPHFGVTKSTHPHVSSSFAASNHSLESEVEGDGELTEVGRGTNSAIVNPHEHPVELRSRGANGEPL